MIRYAKKDKPVTLSQEQKEKAELAGQIITIYLKTHTVPEDGYGALFDRFYEMSLTELRIFNALFT